MTRLILFLLITSLSLTASAKDTSWVKARSKEGRVVYERPSCWQEDKKNEGGIRSTKACDEVHGRVVFAEGIVDLKIPEAERVPSFKFEPAAPDGNKKCFETEKLMKKRAIIEGPNSECRWGQHDKYKYSIWSGVARMDAIFFDEKKVVREPKFEALPKHVQRIMKSMTCYLDSVTEPTL